MSFFVIDSCMVKACQNWRINNKCVKDQMHIPTCIHYAANIHDDSICEVRRQINEFRLNEMLEK